MESLKVEPTELVELGPFNHFFPAINLNNQHVMKNKNRIRLILTIAVLLCSIKQGNAQNDSLKEAELNKNAIYGNLGDVVFYTSATVYYERVIKQHMWNKSISSFAKVGMGKFSDWGADGNYSTFQV